MQGRRSIRSLPWVPQPVLARFSPKLLACGLTLQSSEASKIGRSCAAQVCVSSGARPPDLFCGALLYTFLDESCFDVARRLPQEDAVADATKNASRAAPTGH